MLSACIWKPVRRRIQEKASACRVRLLKNSIVKQKLAATDEMHRWYAGLKKLSICLQILTMP